MSKQNSVDSTAFGHKERLSSSSSRWIEMSGKRMGSRLIEMVKMDQDEKGSSHPRDAIKDGKRLRLGSEPSRQASSENKITPPRRQKKKKKTKARQVASRVSIAFPTPWRRLLMRRFWIVSCGR